MKRSYLQRLISKMISKGIFNFLSDKTFFKLAFWARLNQKLDLENPISLNEKIQWLKLNDRKESYAKIVDKFAVREFIKETLGEEYLVPLVGGPWNSFDEIDFDLLPNNFVLKTTHDSGGVVVVPDKSKMDKVAAKKKIVKSMKNNYFYPNREWPYKNINPQIIAEEYLVDSSGSELKDYKIICFNGKPENVMVCTGRILNQVKFYFFDWNWKFLPLNYGDELLPSDFSIPKPQKLDEMRSIATKLSAGYDLIRIDLYEANNQIYFGEMTLYPDSGFDRDITKNTDLMFGKKLHLTRN